MWGFDRPTIESIVNVVSPDASESGRIARAAERESRVMASLLQDRRLHAWLLERPHEMLAISPHAFFAALLYRVRYDLATRAFTHERASGRMVIVFDVKRVRELLESDGVMAYLSWIPASFVRIHSVTRSVRVRPSTWRRYTVSDFDISSLMGYVRRLDPERRPAIYRRIAEVALFKKGVFLEVPDARHLDEDLVELGTDSYRKALDGGAVLPDEESAIVAICEAFLEAAKALTFMSDHYLGTLRTKVFDL